jgi:probable lipoprotein NlpC
VYLGRGAFLHASTSKGVTISSLDEDYWKSAYWKSRRLT